MNRADRMGFRLASLPPGQPRQAGLWLEVDQLLSLPFPSDAKAELWRLALRQCHQAPAQQQLPLVVALARHCGQACVTASADGQWTLLDDQLEEAVAVYRQLDQLVPDRSAAVRQELINLIGKLLADLHATVHADPAPAAEERGRLCWRGYQLAQMLRQLQPELPDWLWHLEEQLVREGAIGLRELASASDGDAHHQQVWRQQALDLLLHLARLHSPCPEWILLAAQALIAAHVQAELPQDSSAFSATAVQQLFAWLARLPVQPERQASLQLAAQRGTWSLQLLEQNVAPSPRSKVSDPPKAPVLQQPPAAQKPQSTPAPPQPALQRPAPREVLHDPLQLYQALGLAVTNWLADHPAGLHTWRLEPVLRPQQDLVLSGDGVLQFNLAPLLVFPQEQLLDQLMPALFTPLQQADRGGEIQIAEPHSALWRELSRLWSSGGQLKRNQWSGLVYATALWNRCGGPGALEASALGWDLPVAPLEQGQSLLRPGNVELAALQTVLFDAEQLDELLAEIRRRHHDRAWMENQSDRWWYDPNDGSENLRRLHINAGFYASSHAPLESLQRWSQATLRALLGSSVLFGNASITEMFWPVGQQLLQRTKQIPNLVQWPGDQAFYNFIAGKEVLFVTPLASDVEAHHRTGLAFELFTDLQISPYGLRCIEAPVSIYPNRPDRGFEVSLERTLEQVDRAYRQKPFEVFTAASGAYGLPLCEAVKQRYGVSCIYVGNLMHAYFGLLQKTTADWRAPSRIAEHWITSRSLDGVPGMDRLERGRYTSA